MKQILTLPALTAREVYQVLKDLAMGERLPRVVRADGDWLSVETDGWTLTLAHDLEHCQACSAADGRAATSHDWPRHGTDPVSFLSAWERRQLERLMLVIAP